MLRTHPLSIRFAAIETTKYINDINECRPQNREDCTLPVDSFGKILSVVHLTIYDAILPLYSDLFGICVAGVA